MYCRGRSTNKAGRHDSTTSLPISTSGPVGRVFTGDPAINSPETLQLLRGDRKNIPQVKWDKDYGAIRPHGNSIPINQETRKGGRISMCRREDDLQQAGGV